MSMARQGVKAALQAIFVMVLQNQSSCTITLHVQEASIVLKILPEVMSFHVQQVSLLIELLSFQYF